MQAEGVEFACGLSKSSCVPSELMQVASQTGVAEKSDLLATCTGRTALHALFTYLWTSEPLTRIEPFLSPLSFICLCPHGEEFLGKTVCG